MGKKMTGKCTWDNADYEGKSDALDVDVVGVGEDLRISMVVENAELSYLVILSPSQNPGVLVGTWTTTTTTRKGACVARVFKATHGEEMVLSGNWVELGYTYQWITHLKPSGG